MVFQLLLELLHPKQQQLQTIYTFIRFLLIKA